MASYKRFEDVPVWQDASQMDDAIDELIFHAPPRMTRSFRDQLGRASLSVSNNIAEGFERGSSTELLSYIYIARGSAGEVRSMLRAALRRAYMKDHHAEIDGLIALAESCSRQLWAWAESVKNRNIPGARHFNYETGEKYAAPSARQGRGSQIRDHKSRITDK